MNEPNAARDAAFASFADAENEREAAGESTSLLDAVDDETRGWLRGLEEGGGWAFSDIARDALSMAWETADPDPWLTFLRYLFVRASRDGEDPRLIGMIAVEVRKRAALTTGDGLGLPS